MRRRLVFFLAIISLASLGAARPALDQPQILDTRVDYVFGEQATFHATLKSDLPIEMVVILFQEVNNPATNFGVTKLEQTGADTYELTYVHSMSDVTLRAFSYIDYHFEITFQNQEVYQSPSYQFYYKDNRFEWRVRQEGPFQVFWHIGDERFAQSVLDIAQSGLLKIQNILALPVPRTLDIYIYDDARTLQSTLYQSNENWIAGHADPDLGVIVVTLPSGPSQRMLTEQRIPHELMHIMLYQSTNLGYVNLPTWLNEGLASIAELYPNPDYRILLDDAVQRNSLLSMSSLCKTFPRDAAGALLAYAQSASFTGYLRDAYGTNGLQALVTNYANGMDCENGAKTALGKDLKQLERDWHRDVLSRNVGKTAINNLLPWIIILGIVLAVQLGLFFSRIRSKTADQPAN
jgi:hypothetical protein